MIRILWVGCHKLLVNTELIELRKMGFEVYRPQYLTDIYDQSAVLEKDTNPSTLSPDILAILDTTNFFYENVSAETASIINDVFDVCVVTISPNWLKSIVSAFKGKIIFRTYGQPYLLSTEFETIGLTKDLMNRPNFYFLPHSLNSLEFEHAWLTHRAEEVPYWIGEDVFELENTWSTEHSNGVFGLLCPNIENAYYQNHYAYLKKNFKRKFYKVFGVQKSTQTDSWVIGTLERKDLLASFQKLSGFQYTYSEKNTCYLPPIEAAVIGVPILYPKGSLFSKYIGHGGPGEWETETQANALAQRVLNRDINLIERILAAQAKVKDLYRSELCKPIFREVISKIILESEEISTIEKRNVIVPHFFPGDLIFFDGISYSSAEGIPRVIKFYVDTLLDQGYKVKILVYERQLSTAWGYFNQDRSDEWAEIVPLDSESDIRSLVEKITNHVRPLTEKLPQKIKARLRKFYFKLTANLKRNLRKDVLENIQKPLQPSVILFPHYYHFRVLHHLDFSIPVILYLPDYVPHLMPQVFGKEIELYENDGIEIVRLASMVITNSGFTRSYLPKSALSVDQNKIRVFPLPRLGSNSDPKEIRFLKGRLFLFYPTQFRPNKRIDILLSAFESVAEKYDVLLVLTGNLESDGKAKSVYDSMTKKKKVVFLGRVSDSELNWLYKNCHIVVVSSESEGNFPTQLTESIYNSKPFIAADIGVVTEELSEYGDSNLFKAESTTDLVSTIFYVLENYQVELEKVINLKQNYYETRSNESKIGILSAIEESFT
jgi:glycosyltransferase involved in cell wall biosynthesis